MAINTSIADQVNDILQFVKETINVKKKKKERKENDDTATTTTMTKTCLFSATYPSRAETTFYSWVNTPRVLVAVDTMKFGRKEEEEVQDSSTTTAMAEDVRKSELQSSFAKEGKHENDDIGISSSSSSTLENNNNNDSNKRPKSDTDNFSSSSNVDANLTLTSNNETTTTVTKKTQKKQGGPQQQQIDLAAIPKHVTQTLHVCSNHKKPKKLMTTLQKIKRQEQDEKKNKGRRRQAG
eukprot:14149615-Ditylum_brightwellii.AAC.1